MGWGDENKHFTKCLQELEKKGNIVDLRRAKKMKTQFVWACLTRAGVIARKHHNGPLLAAENKQKLIDMIKKYVRISSYSYYNGADYIKKKRLRVAKVKLTIEEVRK